MRKRIQFQFCVIGAVSIFVAAFFISFIFYHLFQSQVMEELKLYGKIFSYSDIGDEQMMEKFFSIKENTKDIRLTLVDQNGKVLFDSGVDERTMDNHKERPEIKEALKNGEGKAIRHSDTVGKNTYYYAISLDDEHILRIAKDANNIISIFAKAFPVIGACIVVFFLICFFLSGYLTSRIIKPIEEISIHMDDLDEKNIYKELQPFVKIIKEQHKDIVLQMKNLKRENKRIQMITDKIGEGLLLLDNKKNIIIANPSAIHLLKIKENDYSGKNYLDFSENQMLHSCIESALQGQKKYVDFSIEDKELQAFANPITDQGKVIGAMCFILDITENSRNEKLRRDFTANVSHELKTPLTSISGYAELIEQGMVSEKDIGRFAEKIRISATRLLALINDIIKLSELDEPQETNSFTRFDLFKVAKECIETLELNANERNISLYLEGESHNILGDYTMIEELIFNLCGNAIRYNKPNGTVTLSVKESDKGIILNVKDTGIGISKKHQERVFERFYRVDKSRSKATGGTGLGLAIVKHIVECHKATICLQSEEGKGTEIEVVLQKS